MHTRNLLLLVFSILTLPIFLYSEIPIVKLERSILNVDFASIDIGYYVDTTKSMSIDQFRQNPDLFSKTKGNHIFKGRSKHVWLAFQLQKDSDDSFRNYLLQLGNAHVAHYDLFQYDDIGLIIKRTQGDNFPYTEREVRHNLFVHNLPDIENDQISIYLRVDQEGQELALPINIFERDYFIQHTLGVKISHGLVLGLFFITSVVTLILFIIYREWFFLYEVIVSIASILYIISEEGYGLMMIWPNSSLMQSLSRPLFVSLVIIFSLLFTIDFLQIRKKQKWMANFSYLSICVFIFYLLLAHPFDLFQVRNENNMNVIISCFLLLLLINCGLIVLIAAWSWLKNKNRDGLVVFLVFGVTVVAILVRLLAVQGLGASSELIEHTGFITRGIHIPLIGGYLIYQSIRNFRENQEARVTLLEEKSKFTKSMIENIDSERQRISMALHDSAGSIITGIKANLQMVQDEKDDNDPDNHLIESLKLTDRLQQEIRNISNDLLPNSITKLGLKSEIKRLLQVIEETYGITTKLESNEHPDKVINRNAIFHLYYIVREALDNSVKYSEAKNILVQYFVYDDEINLLIEDDGVGFNISDARKKGGNGLKNLQLRVSWLHGHIDIYSDNGTSISINIPMKSIENTES